MERSRRFTGVFSRPVTRLIVRAADKQRYFNLRRGILHKIMVRFLCTSTKINLMLDKERVDTYNCIKARKVDSA